MLSPHATEHTSLLLVMTVVMVEVVVAVVVIVVVVEVVVVVVKEGPVGCTIHFYSIVVFLITHCATPN